MRHALGRVLVSLVVLALATGGMAPGEAAAQTTKKMYWVDNGVGKIQRANLDGSGVQDLVTGLSHPTAIAILNVAGRKMYWTNSGAGKIQRANLDGSGVQDLVAGLSSPYGIALNVAAGKMYWAAYGAGRIQGANLDGSGVQDLVAGLSSPTGIALDLSVGNVAHGFQPTTVVCRNLTTRQKVKITLPPGALFSDCAAGGLRVNSGDQLKMTITGSEP